jgi:hypothetical protein
MYIMSNEVQKMARDKDLNGHALRVLFFAWEKLDFAKFKMINQQDWAKELGVHETTIGRCLTQLRERKHLERQGSGPRQEWRLNPIAAWKGTANGFHAMRKERGLKVMKLPPQAQAVFDVIEGGRS